jgi:ankyrin repeat protein
MVGYINKAYKIYIFEIQFLFLLKGNLKIVKSLLKHGADASIKDKRGCTALFYLVESNIDNKKEVVHSLVENKCPIDIRDNQSSTCLIEAVKFNQIGNSIFNHLII